MKKYLYNLRIIKYLSLILVSIILFFLFRITYLDHEQKWFHMGVDSWFYLIFTILIVLLFFEVNHWIFTYFKKKFGKKLFTLFNIIIYQITLFSATSVTLFITLYFMHFHLPDWLNCSWKFDPWTQIFNDFFKSVFVGVFFNTGYLIVAFINYKRTADFEEERIKKENLIIKYESLRNQIDPHFLFNSFSVLNGLIKPNPDLAIKFLNNLSEMYRYMLDNRDNNIIAIKEELKYLEAYISLMQIRHEDCITASIKIADDILQKKIPAMSLQMIAENAIKHNSFNEEKPLSIQIRSVQNYIEIENNKNVRTNVRHSIGIGLENIKNRYLYYSDKRVEVIDNENEFIVKLPVID